jgi:DNA repair exonuclease SbcCD ATPase subunit
MDKVSDQGLDEAQDRFELAAHNIIGLEYEESRSLMEIVSRLILEHIRVATAGGPIRTELQDWKDDANRLAGIAGDLEREVNRLNRLTENQSDVIEGLKRSNKQLREELRRRQDNLIRGEKRHEAEARELQARLAAAEASATHWATKALGG